MRPSEQPPGEPITPNPKSFFNAYVKDHLSAITLVIAILYTFPLGVWDRFFVSREEAARREMSELRKVIQESAELQAKFAAQVGGIFEPELKQQYVMATGARMATLYESSKELFAKYKTRLTTTELLHTGSGFSAHGGYETALSMFEEALKKARMAKMAQSESDANRMIAQIYINPTNVQNIFKGRQYYYDSYVVAIKNRSLESNLQAGYNLGEWGISELRHGDWACGQTLIGKALEITDKARTGGGKAADVVRDSLIAGKRAVEERKGASSIGCPAQYSF